MWRRPDRPGRLERARVCPLGTRSARARCSTCERKLREFQQSDLARPDLQPPQSPRLQRPRTMCRSDGLIGLSSTRTSASPGAKGGVGISAKFNTLFGSPVSRKINAFISTSWVFRRRLIPAGCSATSRTRSGAWDAARRRLQGHTRRLDGVRNVAPEQ